MVLTNREQIDAALFGNMSSGVRQYFQDNLERLNGYIKNFSPMELGSSMINMASNAIRRTLDNEYVRNVNNFLNRERYKIVEEGEIQPIGFANKLYSIKHNPITQNYLMACPNLMYEYRLGNLSGYKGTFVDNEPNTPIDWREDYLETIDGIIFENDDGEYWIECITGNEVEEPLDMFQQCTILNNWDIANRVFKRGKDPTK